MLPGVSEEGAELRLVVMAGVGLIVLTGRLGRLTFLATARFHQLNI